MVEQAPQFPSRTPVNFNIAIAKAEARPVVNIRSLVLEQELDEILSRVRRLKERVATHPPTVFEVETAKKLKEELLRALKHIDFLPSDKLKEVRAALTLLKFIKGRE